RDGGQTESDTSNNIADVPITLTTAPDLTITALSAPTSIMVGNQAPVSYTVTSRGSSAASGSWYDALYLSANGIFDAGDTLIVDQPRTGPAGLAPGGQYPVQQTVQLPSNLPAGSYYLLAVADRRGELAEGSEINNVQAAAITLTAGPDLVLSVAS